MVMIPGKLAFFSFGIFIFICFSFCKHVEGDQINKPIIAAPGDDVILPCRLNSEVDLQDQTVEWSKLDMKPDPFSFVCYYMNRRIITKVMMESFIPRVSLNQDELKQGDVALKIRNVSLQDEGKYSCFIPGKNFRETVQLVVEPNGVRAPTMETSQFNIWISRSRPGLWIAFGLFVLVLSLTTSILCAVWIRRRRRQKFQKPPLV